MQHLPQIKTILRTPESQFANLPDFPYTPHYTNIGADIGADNAGQPGSTRLRVAHIDEGPRDGAIVLLMHGEPTWSYLYRKMIPVLVAAGHRVIAPDLVGFGRSDKPASKDDYSYLNQVLWMCAWMKANNLQNITLFCQDWGSLIGLRMVADSPGQFDRVVLANGGLPTGLEAMPRAFKIWRAFARYSPWFPIGRIVKAGCVAGLDASEVAAYDAPFPNAKYKIAARLFPGFVPTTPNDPERQNNERAWEIFKRWDKPFLTLFSNRDPVTRGGYKIWQKLVPGARGQAHATTRDAGHFLQEDKGAEVAQAIANFIRATPVG